MSNTPYRRLDKNNAAVLLRCGLRAASGLAQRRGGPGALFASHIPDYRNLINSYTTLQAGK